MRTEFVFPIVQSDAIRLDLDLEIKRQFSALEINSKKFQIKILAHKIHFYLSQMNLATTLYYMKQFIRDCVSRINETQRNVLY